ncbi:MAG: ABC transporter ATP-binding protein [Bacteroidetes bacterium]|jgi:iron(III) transport system ATP-binding protein|nr:ABC transporter ATP-binding protein [Bacteroidota bacterium]MBT3748460.1 ABC transporter ATP-binding protein [Bacteroidota bacterium]MBT4397835.1 ABC transporter ATP-binding protein [Bacteroidota bacterium]MBT4412090.1 ABC transporter ATP-binding protein [Bacteroidota bacterium]MBT5424572.1 ABC transporter ATP-binding protein [Bacteroidota bacterium]
MIEIREISKSFSNRQVLNQISLQIDDGETIILMGASGSGKTTLLRLIAGLEMPDHGTILFDRVIMSEPGFVQQAQHRRIGFIFQQPALWPHLTVKKNVLFGNKSVKSERNKVFIELAESCRLSEFINKYPAELSMGEQRRVALARALAANPSYVFLDEALVNLDLSMQHDMISFLKAQQQLKGFSLVYVTHQINDLKQIHGRLLTLHKGLLVNEKSDE